VIEDLFIHISYIEHFVIRVDLIELEIIRVAERVPFFSAANMFALATGS
jgi:hypothetical protein